MKQVNHHLNKMSYWFLSWYMYCLDSFLGHVVLWKCTNLKFSF